jgi:succinate dehydrogenase/fumarate reductase flavoprotein subunit
MANLERLGEVFSNDVLVLGGSMAGLMAAIRAKELNSNLDVLVVDKATTGFSGAKVNKGACMVWILTEEDDLDRFRDYYVREIGCGLEDQELMEKFAFGSRDLFNQLERWGARLLREDNGKFIKFPEYSHWGWYAIDADLLMTLRSVALKLGVKIVDKTQSVEILTENGRAAGAVGFDLISGAYRIFKSKSVVVATGSCCWMVTNMWSSARGDGIAAAYRAGAEMRNAEFSNMHDIGLRGNMSSLMGGQYSIYNDDDEYLAPKYTKPFEPDVDIRIFLGMEKEVMEGRGPIGLEETEILVMNPLAANGLLFRWDRPGTIKFWKTLFEKEAKYMVDHSWRPEVIPAFLGESSPIKVDHEMRTSVPGIWALGDSCRAGSALSGAVPAPCRLRGSGLGWAGVSALLSAQSLADYSTEASVPIIDDDQVKKFKEEIYAPMDRKKGMSPRDGIWRLKEVMSPPRYALRKNKERIEEALGRVKEVRDQADNEVSADNDWHMLGLCQDLKNMSLCSDIVYRSALTRTESRGWHYREDYPKRDDKNWRKWIVVKEKRGKMVVSTEDMPVERYKSKP